MSQHENENDNIEKQPLHEVKYVEISGKSGLKPAQEHKRSDTFYLFFSVMAAIIIKLVGAAMFVWPSPAIVKLKLNDSNINPLDTPITTIQISILTSSPMCTSLFGALFLPSLADKIGRKKSLLLFGFGMFLSQVALAFSKDIRLMIIFTSTISFCYSGVWGLLPMYLTEICEDHNRAKYGCFSSAFLPLGELYTYSIGPLFNLKYLTLLLASPMLLFLILFSFAPESPMYYLSKGKKEECINTLKKLRSNKTSVEIDNDCYKIDQSLSRSKSKKKSNFFTVFKSKEGRIGILLALLPSCIQSFCGVPLMMSLMAPIFNEAGVSISGSTVAIMVGILKVCIYTFTSLVIEKTGRRPMLLSSSVGTGVPIFALGLFFYLKHINSPILSHIQWLPVVSILSYIFFYSIALGPLPSAIMAELFPTDVRSSAISFITLIIALALAMYAFCYPIVAEIIGIHWCFWIFGSFCFGGAIIIYFCLPETKGKSIHEIQEMLRNY